MVPALLTAHGGHVKARIAAIEEVVGGIAGAEVSGDRLRPPEADAAVGNIGCDRTEVEGMIGGMPRPPEDVVAAGVGCKPCGGGDAVGCNSVGCEEAFGGLPRSLEVALVARVECEHEFERSVDDDNFVGHVARPLDGIGEMPGPPQAGRHWE